MAVLVDTNVICDVLYNDPVWNNWSSAQLANYWGQLCINPIIYAELSYQATSPEDVNDTMEKMGLVYADLPMKNTPDSEYLFDKHAHGSVSKPQELPSAQQSAEQPAPRRQTAA